jgi:hypothetical protein
MLAILFILLYIMLYLALCNKVTRSWWWLARVNYGRKLVLGIISIPLCFFPIPALAIVLFFNIRGMGKVSTGHEPLPQETIGSAIEILPIIVIIGWILVYVLGE